MGIFSNLSEKNRTSILHLFKQFHKSTLNRQAELVLRFLPNLFEDFFEPALILPPVLSEFLDSKTHPLLLSNMLRMRIPAMYKTDALRSDISSLSSSSSSSSSGSKIQAQGWIDICMDSIAMKQPPVLALWGLLSLFVAIGGTVYPAMRAMAIEIGSCIPQKFEYKRKGSPEQEDRNRSLKKKQQQESNNNNNNNENNNNNNDREKESTKESAEQNSQQQQQQMMMIKITEIGNLVSTAQYEMDSKFAHHFLVFGTCFFNFLIERRMDSQIKNLIKILDSMMMTTTDSEEHAASSSSLSSSNAQVRELVGAFKAMCEKSLSSAPPPPSSVSGSTPRSARASNSNK